MLELRDVLEVVPVAAVEEAAAEAVEQGKAKPEPNENLLLNKNQLLNKNLQLNKTLQLQQKSESGNNWLGYIIDHVPGSMMLIQPTVDLAKRYSKQRIAPMIRACPVLAGKVRESRSRDSGNTTLLKEFPGGLVVITGANGIFRP